MNIELKKYQEGAVRELVEATSRLLSREGTKKVCIFQAPTGSGKTVMTAKFIEDITQELPDVDLCFVWISIGKGDLHLQSRRSLVKMFEGTPRVSLVEEEFTGGRETIFRNEVVVVNWEKLRTKDRDTGEWKNALMRDGELLNFREVLRKTRELRKIILIIDESHIGATAERTNELRDEIDADVVLEMSATPRLTLDPKDFARHLAESVLVEPKDVIEEGMIKKELIINEKIDEVADEETDSQEVVMEAAFQKRLTLKGLYEVNDSKVNPLVLVQVPNAEAGEDKIAWVKDYLGKKGISESNGRLAVWFAEEKSENLDKISEPDDPIEYLVFKQAVDTGWDCPRADILVKFRESHSEIFEIQTVGRILRMPELKHYAEEDLNRGYIYTNIQSIIVKKEDYNPNIIKHLKSKRISSYDKLDLPSYFRSRIDYGDVTSSFAPVFERSTIEYFGIREEGSTPEDNLNKLVSKGISLPDGKYSQAIIVNASIAGKGFDELEGEISPTEQVQLTIAGNDLQAAFEQVIKDNLGPFRGVRRSVPIVKTAVYSWFRRILGSKDWTEEIPLIQTIFLSNGNIDIFSEVLRTAIEDYRGVKEEEKRLKQQQSERYDSFDVPEESFFNQYTDELTDSRNYVHEPCYLSAGRSSPEKRFEKFLNDNAKSVVWWWKNGENMQTYFGIRYEFPGGSVHTFYPDYIVLLKDSRIGIFEVKDVGDRDGLGMTKVKAERLQEYFGENGSKNLFGGIVIERNNTWIINNGEAYDWEKCQKGGWSDWMPLSLGTGAVDK
jgi:type III restriction enzyme